MMERIRGTHLLPPVAATAFLYLWLGAPGPVVGQALPGILVPAPEGTVATFELMSSGSFGGMKGQVVRRWTKRDWNGLAVVAVVSEDGSGELWDTQTCATMATLEKDGRVRYTYDPPLGYDWPLEVGKKWSSAHRLRRTYPFKEDMPMNFDRHVEAYEDVVVPAGTFKAFKIVSTSSLGGSSQFGGSSQAWVVPALGLCGQHAVKRIEERPASHWLGGGRRESVMVSRAVPER